MPSPNDARKASAKKTPEKKIDFGPKLAKRRSQDFASKIQGWNQAGGGIVQQEDEVVVIEDSEVHYAPKRRQEDIQIVVETESIVPESQLGAHETIEITPTTPVSPSTPAKDASGSKKAGRDVDLSRGAWVRRKSKPQVEPAPAPPTKQVATPKKRVVSDGHWRRDRTAVKEEDTPIKEKEKERNLTPKPMVIRKSVVNVGLKVPVSHQDFSESASEAEPEPTRVRPLRHPRSRSASRSADDRDATPDYETSGTKVYIKHRRRGADSREVRDARKSESSYTAPSSIDKTGSATDITTPSESSRKENLKRPRSEPRRESNRQTRDNEPRPKSARQSLEVDDALRVPSDSRRRPKTAGEERKPSLRMSKSAEAYARQITENIRKAGTPPTAPAGPKLHGNRIEGWLDNMPDPFTESSRSSLTPEPLAIPKRKSTRRTDTEGDSDSARENRRSGGHRRSSRKDRADEQYLANEYADDSPSTPTTLKRSGARRKSSSPVKNRDSRESTPNNLNALMSGALPSISAPTSRNTSSAHRTRPRIPSGGRPLSTVVSTDTRLHRGDPTKRHPLAHSEDTNSILDGSVLSRVSDGDSPRRHGSGLKRRGTKRHTDLMSVLSQDDTHTVVSRRSVRASRRRAAVATTGDIMNDLSVDELKYQRELRTLVDGVIPVLLQHAVSRSESSARERVFSAPMNYTKPVVDMGIALERLKNTHRRIPMHEPSELLVWAESASKVYADYLQTWRLGFKDIVVNLAPAEQSTENKTQPEWADGLPRNKDGDLTNTAGERVDVAYLLKRPLVRLKYLNKAFRGLHQLQPSAKAEDIAERYQSLIADAKKRVVDEEARLEDEAAASIDAKRARDPRSLAPITGVTIDPTRSVRARDYFDMDLVHSSGQQIGCKIEVIYRDDAPDRGKAGDILFCEISSTGRWLLFPPIPISLVTARSGDRPGQMVVMIRGFLSNARQWREVMSLRAEDDQTSKDWTDMLGSSPMPPRLTRRSSFNMFKERNVSAPETAEPKFGTRDTPDNSRDPSPRDVDVPLGEQAKATSRIWDSSEVNSVYNDEDTSEGVHKAQPRRYRNTVSSPPTADVNHQASRDDAAQPGYFYEQPRHETYSDRTARRPVTSHARSKSDWTGSTTGSTITSTSQSYSVWMPSEDRYSDEESQDGYNEPQRKASTRPKMHRRTSSVPSLELPTIPKLRQSSQPQADRPESPVSDRDLLPSQSRREVVDEPSSAPAKLQKRRLSMFKSKDRREAEDSSPSSAPKQPSPPSQSKQRPLSLGLKTGILPSFTPAFLKKDRRPSSPLKHQYEPSSESDSLTDSDLSELDDIESITSESTVDDEVASTIGDLKGFQQYNMRDLRPAPLPESPPTTTDGSLRPSESASAYRSVPPATMEPAKTVACIFSWSQGGSWDSLHPEECQIFVTPGLIEAFDLTQANAAPMLAEGETGVTPSSRGVKPLVALELTPLVPLRRGTAVDISIRSPPTTNSLIRTGNNVMFRSRSPEECERLYSLINRARIDNPTYIALQNARGPVQTSNWAEVMDRRNNARTASGASRSWWNLGSKRSNSYRSKGSRTASVAATDSSVGTMNTAFSALRRFSGSSRIFNIAKSTITSREGTRSSNSESLSSGAATPIPYDPRMGTPMGITNTKIRLYVRDSPSKWRDMGPARMTVLLPPRPDPAVAANPKMTGLEKRVVISGKSAGEVMLDVTLNENAFERVARTGIAVSVYEECEHIGASGGVLVAKTTVYMVQMKSERDAAHTFGLVGKLRY